MKQLLLKEGNKKINTMKNPGTSPRIGLVEYGFK